MPDLYLNVARSFSPTPGGRYRIQGAWSGEEFRDSVLLPRFELAQRLGCSLIIVLDGGAGYGSGFLEEAFGGLARLKGVRETLSILRFVSDQEPYLNHDVERYIREA